MTYRAAPLSPRPEASAGDCGTKPPRRRAARFPPGCSCARGRGGDTRRRPLDGEARVHQARAQGRPRARTEDRLRRDLGPPDGRSARRLRTPLLRRAGSHPPIERPRSAGFGGLSRGSVDMRRVRARTQRLRSRLLLLEPRLLGPERRRRDRGSRHGRRPHPRTCADAVLWSTLSGGDRDRVVVRFSERARATTHDLGRKAATLENTSARVELYGELMATRATNGSEAGRVKRESDAPAAHRRCRYAAKVTSRIISSS